MIEFAKIAQAVSVVAACWAIITGVGAWKREFIGKRKIELAEETLAAYFEIRDAIAFIRSPFSRSTEGSTRERASELKGSKPFYSSYAYQAEPGKVVESS